MASVTGTVNTFGYLKDWIAVAYDTDTHAYANSAIVSSGTYNISGLTTGKLYNIVVKPKIGNIWTANTNQSLNSYCVPTNASGTPYVYEVTTGTVIAANTKLVVAGYGSDNSTPSTLDAVGHTPTYVGNARIRTDQYKWFGYGSSLYFDGTGDSVTFLDSADFELGAENFYLRGWVRFAGYPTYNNGFYTSTMVCKDNAAGRSFTVNAVGTASSFTALAFNGFSDTNNYTAVTASWSPSLNTWYFVEVSRNSNLVYLFVDGVLLNAGGTAFSRTMQNTTTVLRLGANEYDTNFKYYLNGYLSDWEMVVGTAGHTANYTTPTTPLLALTGSSEPTWPTTPSDTVTDNGVVWTNRGQNIRPKSFFQIAT